MQKYLPGETVVYSAKNELGKEFEFVLPEYLPGISRIVKLALGTEKCVFSAISPSPEMNISLRISIMYISEHGGKIKNAVFHESVTLPFNEPFTHEGDFTAVPSCHVTNSSAVPVTNRKVEVKCNLFSSVSVYSSPMDENYVDSGKDSICLLKEQKNVCRKTIIPEESFEHEAQITLDSEKPSAGEVIYTSARFAGGSATVSDGKLEFEAKVSLNILYEISQEDEDDTDASYASCSTEIILNDAIHSEKFSETASPYIYIDICSAEPSVSFDPYGSNKAISLLIKYNVSGFLYDSYECEIITDAFSESCHCTPVFSKASLDSIQSKISSTSLITIPVRADIRDLAEISSCNAEIHSVSIEHAEGKFFANAKCIMEILGANTLGELFSLDAPVMLRVPLEFSSIPLQNSAPDVLLNVSGCSARIKEGGLEADFEIGINGVMTEHIQQMIVSDLIEDSAKSLCKNKGEIIICYPCKDETLWSVAKKYAVNPEKIKAANGIDDDTFNTSGTIMIPQ